MNTASATPKSNSFIRLSLWGYGEHSPFQGVVRDGREGPRLCRSGEILSGGFTHVIENNWFAMEICVPYLRGMLDRLSQDIERYLATSFSPETRGARALSRDRYSAFREPADFGDRHSGAEAGGAENPGRIIGLSRSGGSDPIGSLRRGFESGAG